MFVDPNLELLQMSNHSESSSPPYLRGGADSRKRKRQKVQSVVAPIDDQSRTRWRTESEQRIYSKKLLDALRHVSRNDDDENNNAGSSSSTATNPRNVRAAADLVLAVAAKGRTRWSRAILKSRRLRSKMLKKVAKKNPNKLATSSTVKASISSSKPSRASSPLDKRLRTLSGLVPGGRKMSLPNLLEETTDYIAALEMQVRAMAALAQFVAGAGVAPPSGSNPTSRR